MVRRLARLRNRSHVNTQRHRWALVSEQGVGSMSPGWGGGLWLLWRLRSFAIDHGLTPSYMGVCHSVREGGWQHKA